MNIILASLAVLAVGVGFAMRLARLIRSVRRGGARLRKGETTYLVVWLMLIAAIAIGYAACSYANTAGPVATQSSDVGSIFVGVIFLAFVVFGIIAAIAIIRILWRLGSKLK